MPRVVTHYPVGIWLMASAENMGGPRAPTSRRCRAACLVYRQCVLKGAAVNSNTIQNCDTGCRTSVAMHNAIVQPPLITVSPNSNPTIAMLHAEADSIVNTMSFHSIVHDCRSSHLWRRKRLWFPVKGKRNNGCLADIPLCCKRRRTVRAVTERCVRD
ncbi:hypothetical protein TNCV_4235721 [Trichonephila clavipes]|nr:hypothetical protein TNCV_4235721 [Trichonephila clavipes]